MMLSLPAAFEPIRERLLQTKKPFIRLIAEDASVTPLWAGKVGGVPYLPLSTPMPTTPEGNPLFFLAQINFAEMPPLAPFPTQGIVSFFINDDDLYGMDFDDPERQDTFRVLYFPDPVKDPSLLYSKYPVQNEVDLLPHHPEQCFPLRYELAEEVVPVTDYEFSRIFGADFFRQFEDAEWDMVEAYGKAVRAQGHKVGGYAYFTQDDPRRADDPMLLLFQLDSDEKMDLMWGDMGIGHFFIREKDLIARDFSRILYDWDCL